MAVAVIGILVAIIFPALGGAQTSARRAKTRVQFSQWSAAIEQFRQEYGYYPNFTQFTDGKIDAANDTHQFVQTLSGRQLNGTAMTTAAAVPEGLGLAAGNTKRISFCTFGSNDLTNGGLLQDAFGNTEFVVLMDRNLNGVITFGSNQDYPGTPPQVAPPGGGAVDNPVPNTSVIIRAGVAFYSAGDGQTPLTSW